MPPWFRGLITALIYLDIAIAVGAFCFFPQDPIPGIYYFIVPEVYIPPPDWGPYLYDTGGYDWWNWGEENV